MRIRKEGKLRKEEKNINTNWSRETKKYTEEKEELREEEAHHK